jgi:chemotaxis protein methyltransferase CheR
MYDPSTFDATTLKKFSEIVYNKAGIVLGEKKEALMQARIGKRMRKLGLTDFRQYLKMIEEDEDGDEIVQLLDVISTNVTNFFRENRHFELLKIILQRWVEQGLDKLRIWCAASSSGEEPYSIAITVKETLPYFKDVKILATDISTKVLAKAKTGRYEERNMENVSKKILNNYFVREKIGNEIFYVAENELKRMITFARLNLIELPFPMKGPFDVIFCRNVMIYFDNPTRTKLLSECERLLKNGGYLMVGHAESLSGLLSNLKPVEPSVYIKE